MFQSIIIGNLGADAELHTEQGNEFVTFKVAHTDRITKADGTTQEETVWVSCLLNGRADNLRKYLTKGTRVCVIGDASLRTFHSAKMQRLVAGCSLFVRSIELVGGKADEVPRYLFDKDGVQQSITKWYLCTTTQETTLFDRAGQPYTVDKKGWVTPEQPTQQEPQNNSSNDTTGA